MEDQKVNSSSCDCAPDCECDSACDCDCESEK